MLRNRNGAKLRLSLCPLFSEALLCSQMGNAVTSIRNILTGKKGCHCQPHVNFCPIPTDRLHTKHHVGKKQVLKTLSTPVSKTCHCPISQFPQFHNMGVLGINRADTGGWMGSMGLASQSG